MIEQKDDRLKRLKKLARRISRYPDTTVDMKQRALDDIGRLAVKEGMKETELRTLKDYMDQLVE